MNKQLGRERRAKKTRSRIQKLGVPRLSVYRTPRHIYAQVIAVDGKVLASTSTLSAEFKQAGVYGGNVAAAAKIGELIAAKIKALNLTQIAFDRAGFRYHGRVKALADAARAQGVNF